MRASRYLAGSLITYPEVHMPILEQNNDFLGGQTQRSPDLYSSVLGRGSLGPVTGGFRRPLPTGEGLEVVDVRIAI
jgi:hypothetical protein